MIDNLSTNADVVEARYLPMVDATQNLLLLLERLGSNRAWFNYYDFVEAYLYKDWKDKNGKQ